MTLPADIVLLGNVYTGDAVRRWSGGVAVRGDRVVALGTAQEVTELVGPRTRVVDAAGKLVLPGFQDAHVHAPFAGRNRLNLALNDLVGRQAYLDAIREYADAHPDRPWVVGGGWAMEYFPGGTPHRDDLDAVVADRPVFLFNRDVHGAWVNTRALEVAGIDDTTPDPPDGRYERDAAGLTGMLHEGAAYSFNDRVVPAPDRAEWEAAVLEAQRHLHALGVTGWQDAWVTPATLDAYLSLASSGALTARVVGALWWDRHRGLEQVGDLLDQRERAQEASVPVERGRGSFHARTVKIMTDGVLENYTGALIEPYCDGCGGLGRNTGLTYVDADLLVAAVTQLDEAGFQVHMHTIGDRAVRNALDAVEAAATANGHRDARHHLAHIQIVQPEDVVRFRRLGVVANCQAYWAQNEPQMTKLTVPFVGQSRVDLMYPFADLLRSGAVLAMGSDWPVSTANPLLQIEVAVARRGPESRDRPAFRPDQALSLADAVAAFTSGSAYVNFDDRDAGTLEVGRRADIVVLDRDLFAPDEGRAGDVCHVGEASVELTVAAGTVVHDVTAGG
jgi:predicted amidohydrolase YtcJ